MNVSNPAADYDSRRSAFTLIAGDVLRFALILLGGLLFSAQVRLKIPLGAPLGEGYTAIPPTGLLLVMLGGGIGAAVYRGLSGQTRKSGDMLAALAGAAFAALGMILLAPDISQLQVLYFAVGSVLIAVVALVLTPAKYPLRASLLLLWRNKRLLALWVRYNVASRYSQTMLGILWIVALPVSTALIFTVVFSFILKAKDIGDVPFVSFFLSGLMFWSLFTQAMLNGSASIVTNITLIGQIYFPREILVLVKLGEALVDLLFVFAITVVINLVVGVPPNANYIFLPLLIGLQLALTLGIMFFTSYLTVIVRDIQPLISVFIQMLFYLTPLMYPIDILPPTAAEAIKFFNPIAALINAYRDVIIYNRRPDFEGLYFTAVLALLLLYSGYMFFKANEKKLADFR